MELDLLLRFIFILYCTVVGMILVLAPWMASWDQLLAPLAASTLRLLQHPVLRGGLSGFGLVHLLWALHDLGAMLRQVGENDEP